MKLFAEIVPDKASLKKMKREVEGVKPKVGAKTPATPAPAPATPAPAVPSGDMGMGALIMPMMKMLAPLMIIAAGIGMLIKVLMDLEPIKAIMEMINNILKIALLPVAMMLMRYLMPVLIWLMKAMRQGFWKTLFGVEDEDKTIIGQLKKRPPEFEGGPTLAEHLHGIDWAGIFEQSARGWGIIFDRIGSWIGEKWHKFLNELEAFLENPIKWLGEKFWNFITDLDELLGGYPSKIGGVLLNFSNDLWEEFLNFLSNLNDKLGEFPSKLWDGFLNFLSDLETRLKGFPSMVWNNFTNAISRGSSALRELGRWILSWARSQIRRVASRVTGGLIGGRNVSDFVITPNGVLKTHPNDYLIGTKNPDALGGGSGTTINIKVDGVATDEIVRQMERKLARVVRNMDVI